MVSWLRILIGVVYLSLMLRHTLILGIILFFCGQIIIVSCSRKVPYSQGADEPLLSRSLEKGYLIADSTGHIMDIDVESIMQDCENLYFGIHAHYFTDDECSGRFAVKDIPQLNEGNVLSLTQQFIQTINEGLADMEDNEYWQADLAPEPSTPQCIPIRFILLGVHVHCDSKAQTTSVTFNPYRKYTVDDDRSFNVFFANVTSASGFADGGNKGMLVMENYSPGLFIHEMGHNFDLSHAYKNEYGNAQRRNGCMDVYMPDPWQWDKDGDGKMDDKKPRGNCWDALPGGDANGNGIGDYCEGRYVANPHPCCSWDAQDNNIMVSSAWADNPTYAAVTPCQIRVMMEKIKRRYTGRILHAGGCKPSVMRYLADYSTQPSTFTWYADQGIDMYRLVVERPEGKQHYGWTKKKPNIDLHRYTASDDQGIQLMTDSTMTLWVEATTACGVLSTRIPRLEVVRD